MINVIYMQSLFKCHDSRESYPIASCRMEVNEKQMLILCMCEGFFKSVLRNAFRKMVLETEIYHLDHLCVKTISPISILLTFSQRN